MVIRFSVPLGWQPAWGCRPSPRWQSQYSIASGALQEILSVLC
jgi:hypothetical protein